MGQTQSGVESSIYTKDLKDLRSQTQFTSKEIQEYYDRFHADFPTGLISREAFIQMYCDMCPNGDAESFADHLFRAQDVDNNGSIDFKEFLITISIAQKGSVEDRLRWAFKMYDMNGDGSLSRSELVDIIDAIYKMRGRNDRQKAEDAALKVYIALDKYQDASLSQEEFVDGCKKCGSLLSLIYDPE